MTKSNNSTFPNNRFQTIVVPNGISTEVEDIAKYPGYRETGFVYFATDLGKQRIFVDATTGFEDVGAGGGGGDTFTNITVTDTATIGTAGNANTALTVNGGINNPTGRSFINSIETGTLDVDGTTTLDVLNSGDITFKTLTAINQTPTVKGVVDFRTNDPDVQLKDASIIGGTLLVGDGNLLGSIEIKEGSNFQADDTSTVTFNNTPQFRNGFTVVTGEAAFQNGFSVTDGTADIDKVVLAGVYASPQLANSQPWSVASAIGNIDIGTNGSINGGQLQAEMSAVTPAGDVFLTLTGGALSDGLDSTNFGFVLYPMNADTAAINPQLFITLTVNANKPVVIITNGGNTDLPTKNYLWSYVAMLTSPTI